MYSKTILVIFCLIVNRIYGREPSCSRFHYEEQTLEKMIRLEIFVEKIKGELAETQKQVMNALDDLKNERSKLHANFDEMENKNAENLAKYSAELKNIQESSFPVAFKAMTVSDKSLYENKAIVFGETFLDTNEVYNNRTGYFVAPVAGIYLLTAQMCIEGDDWVYFGIYVEEKSVSRFAAGDKLGGCFSFDDIVTVEVGQQVSVRCAGSCEGDKLWESGILAASSFAGTLLHKS